MENRAFWSKVRRGKGCWLWTASINNKGYGRYRVNGREWLAHRFAYTVAKGPIPTGILVMHDCDTPLCVNPAHLSLGTHWDNNHDCIGKDRDRKGSPQGEKNVRAKLTEAAVLAIRSAYIAGTPRSDMTEKYGIDAKTLTNVCSGKSWKHLLGVNGAPALADLQAANRNTKQRYEHWSDAPYESG